MTVSAVMEREAERASEKEEAFVEEEDAGILVRKKRDIAGGKENGSHQPEQVVAGGEQRSVFVDGDQGILSTDETSGMPIREGNLFIDDKDNIQVNGKNDFRSKEFHNLDNSLVSEEKSNSRSTDVIPENRSTSDFTKGCDEFGVMRSEFEVEEDVHFEVGKKSKLDVTEIYLEKVLEEQETHDMYCPNCNSCITKRVILRKRKRTVPETQCDTPPAKVQQQHLGDTAASADEMPELSHDRVPDVFRCLACFSFFIPTGAGFNIFRLFRRGGEAETSQLLPEKTGNIGPPVLKPVDSSESDLPVSTAITIDSVQQMGELSTNTQTNPVTNALGATSSGESQITTKKNGAGSTDHLTYDTSFNIFQNFRRGRETGNLRSSQQLPAKNVTWYSSIFNSSASTNTASQSGVQFGEPNNIIGEDPSFKEKQRPLTNVVSDAIILEEDTKIREHFINNGKQVGNPADGIIQRYLDKIEPEDLNLGKGQAITALDAKNWINDGKQVGDFAKGSMQKYLNKTGSEDPNLGKSQPITSNGDTGDDAVGPIDIITHSHSQFSQKINVSVVTSHQAEIYVGEPTEEEAGRRRDWDVLKSIVYGGLVEAVTSLSIVSSAAGGDASTLNIVALALANLIGGLFVIAHDISELRNTEEAITNQNGEPVGRYWELLGKKENYRRHAAIAVLSYILMGLLPPIIYGFSFRKSDNKEYKLIAVAAASLVCISLLAIGKARANAQRAYIKNLAYYLSLGYAASGLSYVAGVMIHRLLDQLGLYDNSAAAPVPPDIYSYIGSTLEAWASS